MEGKTSFEANTDFIENEISAEDCNINISS
jgi:hypothetical protein